MRGFGAQPREWLAACTSRAVLSAALYPICAFLRTNVSFAYSMRTPVHEKIDLLAESMTQLPQTFAGATRVQAVRRRKRTAGRTMKRTEARDSYYAGSEGECGKEHKRSRRSIYKRTQGTEATQFPGPKTFEPQEFPSAERCNVQNSHSEQFSEDLRKFRPQNRHFAADPSAELLAIA